MVIRWISCLICCMKFETITMRCWCNTGFRYSGKCWMRKASYPYRWVAYKSVLLQGVQLKSGPLTKPWIFHVRCYLQWFCWYDIILLHVQEFARLLQEMGEPVLAIRISWISRQWVLVLEQRRFLRFHNAVNSGRMCIYFGKLFKKRCLTPTVDKVSLKNIEGKCQ